MATGGTGFVKVNIPKPKVKDIKTTTSSATRSSAYSTSGNTRTSVFNTPTTTRPVAVQTSNSYSNRPTAANINRQLGGGAAAYNVMGQKGINPWAPNNGITGFGQQLNANRTPAFNFSNFDYGYYDNYQQPEMSTLDWIMAGSMMAGQALNLAADITNAVKEINNEKTDKSTSSTTENPVPSMLGDLKGKKSLNDINSAIKTKKNDYANFVVDLPKLEANSLDLSSISNETIKSKMCTLPNDNLLTLDMGSFDVKELSTYADGDEGFKNGIANANTYGDGLVKCMNNLRTYLNTLDANATNPSKSDVEAAIQTLQTVHDKVVAHRVELENKYNEFKRLQEFMVEAQNKLYERAQQIQQELTAYKNKMDSLNNDIEQLIKQNPQDKDKIIDTIIVYNDLAGKYKTDMEEAQKVIPSNLSATAIFDGSLTKSINLSYETRYGNEHSKTKIYINDEGSKNPSGGGELNGQFDYIQPEVEGYPDINYA